MRRYAIIFCLLSITLVYPAENTTLLFNGVDLEGWEITDFGTQGRVTVQNGSFILGMGEGATGVTWKGDFPTMDYQVTLEANRISGHDFFCGMTFPVNESYLTLIVGGWGGFVVGLSCLDGLDASENETATMKTFKNDRWYAIRLSVHDNIVKVWIDDIKVIDCDTSNRELSLRSEVLLSRPFGIASWYTKAGIRNLKLEEIGKKE